MPYELKRPGCIGQATDRCAVRRGFLSPLQLVVLISLMTGLSQPPAWALGLRALVPGGSAANSSKTPTTQTQTSATTTTSETQSAAANAAAAQASLTKATLKLQALQATNASRAATALMAVQNQQNAGLQRGQQSGNTPGVVDGLTSGGLVPQGGVPTTSSANSSANNSVVLVAGTALTIPKTLGSNEQITVSGSATISNPVTGALTTLSAGASATVPPGAIISMTQGGTVTFAGSSVAPQSFATFNIPASWSASQIGGVTQASFSQGGGQGSNQIAVTLTQKSQQAVLDWDSFNVGYNTTLAFDQSAGGSNVGNWVVINKVADNVAPTQVLGAIEALGQVYVINQNGIIFGGASQVNVHTLAASSLPINNNLVSAGLLDNPDQQFLFSQLNIPANQNGGGTPAFTPDTTGSSDAALAPNLGTIASATAGGIVPANSKGQDGDVIVEAGAQIMSPSNAESVGGRITLVGPNVANNGAIAAPDGQVILAAGLQAYFGAHSSNDPSLRGLDVAVGQITDPDSDYDGSAVAGVVSNGGLIAVPEGDISLAGSAVNQNGALYSTTSVALNGRIDLNAAYGYQLQPSIGFGTTLSGDVTFGPQSSTQILPEYTSTATAPGTAGLGGILQLALPSQINVSGADIHLEADPGSGSAAVILAPSANVTMNASNEIYLDSGIGTSPGATIDVSGSTNITASVDEDILALQLRGSQLENAPLQQSGPLRGDTIYIDILDSGLASGQDWVGTPLADTSGYVGLIPHTVGELTTNGGVVNLTANGAVVLGAGSEINVSGGYITYQGAMVPETLVMENGLPVPISQAIPNEVYQGLYTGFTVSSEKWGYSATYTNPFVKTETYVAGFTQGGEGGALNINSPNQALNGQLYANTVAGQNQRSTATQIISVFGGTPSFSSAELAVLGAPDAGSLSLLFSPSGSALTSPNVFFDTDQQLQQFFSQAQNQLNPFGAVDAQGNPLPIYQNSSTSSPDVMLSQDLVNKDGFGYVLIDTSESGNITISPGVTMTALSGGTNLSTPATTNGTGIEFTSGATISLTAANIDVEGSINVPGGTLNLTASDISEQAYQTETNQGELPVDDPTRGHLTLGANASLSVAGLTVDDLPSSVSAGSLPYLTSGGEVVLKSYYGNFEQGSTIDASGGIQVSPSGKLTYAPGGSIDIEAGRDTVATPLIDGSLTLDSSLSAYSGSVGGDLTVVAPLIQIGGTTPMNGGSAGQTLWLNQTDASGGIAFFDEGGFSKYTLTAIGVSTSENPTIQTDDTAFLIAPGTRITPVEESLMAVDEGNSLALVPQTEAEAGQLLASQRSPVSLAFNAPESGNLNLNAGAFVLGAGALIQTDPLGSVSINSETAEIQGQIISPGGNISVKTAGTYDNGVNPLVSLDLADGSLLSAAGVVEATPNSLGYSTGNVLSGGSISLDGNIVIEAGAQLNVDGASGKLDVASGSAGVSLSGGFTSSPVVTAREDSSGGTISIKGEEELFIDANAKLQGAAGSPGAGVPSMAQGGTLAVLSGGKLIFSQGSGGSSMNPLLISTLDVSQAAPEFQLTTSALEFDPSIQTGVGGVVQASNLVESSAGVPLYTYFGVNTFASGGFDSLTLGGLNDGAVQFSGPVVISARGQVTLGGSGTLFGDAAGDPISITAPYVVLGTSGLNSQLPESGSQTQQAALFGVSGNPQFVYVPPTTGNAALTINASELADVGDLSLQGIGTLNFNGSTDGAGNFVPAATAGDVRGDGSLDVVGSININAAQIYPPTETTFTIAAYDLPDQPGSGSISIYRPTGQSLPALPYSAGATLNLFASNITQGGVLRAPFGTINLGSGITNTSPIDPLSGEQVDSTQKLNLLAGSVTSVSAVDPNTGVGLTIPYGVIENGSSWIDPSGADITDQGPPTGAVYLEGAAVTVSGAGANNIPGATIDLRGGGDLFAYQWVPGVGGSYDTLNASFNAANSTYTAGGNSTSFAIIPDYGASYAPVAPYNNSITSSSYSSSTLSSTPFTYQNPIVTTNNIIDGGYVSNGLQIGEQIYLGPSSGLPAGVYTLLPARYAEMPGAVLITPEKSGTAGSTIVEPNGASLVSGYEVNAFTGARQSVQTTFQVESQSLVNASAEYDRSLANTFFPTSAATNNQSVPRLPIDAGQVVFAATQALDLPASQFLLSQPASGGRGSDIDIASPDNIYIGVAQADGSAPANVPMGDLFLDSASLTLLDANSLVIGGFRNGEGTSLTVTTNNLEVNNAGAGLALSADDLVLASNGILQVDQGSMVEASANAVSSQPLAIINGENNQVSIASSSTTSTTVTLASSGVPADFGVGSSLLGSTVQSINGTTVTLASDANANVSNGAEGFSSSDGAVLRVSSDPSASITRGAGISLSDPAPKIAIGEGVTIQGSSLILDSTGVTSLDPNATLKATTASIDSGQISLVLDNSQPTSGLVLSQAAFAGLQASAQSLSLLSYSSIDIYYNGTGPGGTTGPATIGAVSDGKYQIQSLALHADEIQGIGGGEVDINAQSITIDNSTSGIPSPVGSVPANGTLALNAGTVQLGGGSNANVLNIDGYANVKINASGGIIARATATTSQNQDALGDPLPGSATLAIAGNLQITAPLLTGAAGADQTIDANGTVTVNAAATAATVNGGLGATLSLIGQSVTIDGNIKLPSGTLNLEATATASQIAAGVDGNVVVGGELNVAGEATPFNNLLEYTSGGAINLTSDNGSVELENGGVIDVSAQPGGGSAGSLSVSATSVGNGGFILSGGVLKGQSGVGGQNGTFSLDVGGLADFDALETAVTSDGFTQAQTLRVRSGDVTINGTVLADSFNLSTDQGSITVNGEINASGTGPASTGGSIDLSAHGSVVLAPTSLLTVEGATFNAAGKGGSVTLQAGTSLDGVAPSVGSSSIQGNGTFVTGTSVVDVEAGARIVLTVDAATSASAANGDFAGTLTIEAPRTSDDTNIQVDPIDGTIVGASSIAIIGNQVYDLTSNASSGGVITSAVQSSISSDGISFLGAAGTTTNGYTAMLSRLFGGNADAVALTTGPSPIANIEAGVEIDDTAGNLTLGSPSSTIASDWNLAAMGTVNGATNYLYRFGPNAAPGILTLRASGNLIFDNSLSDGFTSSTVTGATSGSAYNAVLMPANGALPMNNQSWSYNLTAGADLNAASSSAVLPLGQLVVSQDSSSQTGSIMIGRNDTEPFLNGGSGLGSIITTNRNGTRYFYQVIRTGTGNINIAAGNSVLLLNQFATIYTAGVQAPLLNNFDVPQLLLPNSEGNGFVDGYPAQYAYAGGNVSITAQNDIAHETQSIDTGLLVPDSEQELPNNWLDRRGAVNSAGDFANADPDAPSEDSSTSWWVDFSNFFEGVGALGGGNVTLRVGGSVSNVDAVVPTSEQTSFQSTLANGSITSLASQQTTLELGGGNLVVSAANDINGGVYYVENGSGFLSAGNQVTTNVTRAPDLPASDVGFSTDSSLLWLPTTLFLGTGNFTVAAGGSLDLGSVANPFLLPESANEPTYDVSYFSTFGASDAVKVSSLSGNVTLTQGGLETWLSNVLDSSTTTVAPSSLQPWLQLNVSTGAPLFAGNSGTFGGVVSLMPPTLSVTADSASINLVNGFTLTPSATGNLDLAAEGAINGLQPGGIAGGSNFVWGYSTINVSDANPASVPGIFSPTGDVLGSFDALFDETGATQDVSIQTQQQLHDSTNDQALHANDPNPIQVYALNGNISGLTLFAPKATQIVAGQDITDVSFYLQNTGANDVSLVDAGRDIVLYDPSSILRAAATASGNELTIVDGQPASPEPGDIQIGGPGTLEVLAGRNLTLGNGPENVVGGEASTGVGITSIGNSRNPILPPDGANIVALAGLGTPATGLGALDFTNSTTTGFNDLFLNPATGGTEADRYLPDLATLLGLSGINNTQAWDIFSGTPDSSLTPQEQTIQAQLTPEMRDNLALSVFYLVLRDAGRDFNDPSSPNSGSYKEGFAAIQALFPNSSASTGDITMTGREIKTTNGGSISLLAPDGQLTVSGNQLISPSTNPFADQGLVTTSGGNINVFTKSNVNIGTSRIFTLDGGNLIVWSSFGNIAAGISSKTVVAAPPTRVLVNPQSGNVQNDLAGLDTGGGIGVLASVAGAPPSDVDLIAPNGVVDAGDAGIRVSGNINIAAVQVLNAGNITVGGKSTGVPTVTAPNVAGATSANSVSGALTVASQAATQNHPTGENAEAEVPSIVTIQVIGYGGGDDDSSDDSAPSDNNGPAGNYIGNGPLPKRSSGQSNRP